MKKGKMSVRKRVIKVLLCVLAAVVVLAGAYLGYVMIRYYRIGDQPLTVENNEAAALAVGKEYELFCWNIGFGAYTRDYDFFMDGGKQSRASSGQALEENMTAIAGVAALADADIYLFQEVDIDSDRSYHRDEREDLNRVLQHRGRLFAQNYDSPYLFYPLLSPHGASESGLMTYSRFEMHDAQRVELPVEEGLTRFLDLDRCYSKVYMPTENGKEVVLYNLHLSAYSSDGSISVKQLELLLEDMQQEAEKGNYCIAGGDFNKDIAGNSSEVFGCANSDYTWAQPLPEGMVEKYGMVLTVPEMTYPTCRNADSAYHAGQYVVTVDGFLTSRNVQSVSARVWAESEDQLFLYSDHNPVMLVFSLME